MGDIGAAGISCSGGERARSVPLPEKYARAAEIEIEGKGGHKVALRVVAPERAKGIYLHFHGGGLVLGSAMTQTC